VFDGTVTLFETAPNLLLVRTLRCAFWHRYIVLITLSQHMVGIEQNYRKGNHPVGVEKKGTWELILKL
jgi:hypothetical protein